jgi:predicted ATP-grasp superfamily ATP-dependent carboligase
MGSNMGNEAGKSRVVAGAAGWLRRQPALILGHHRQSLVVARSLDRAGFAVVMGSTGKPSLVESSRHVTRCWRHPEFDADAASFNASLAEFARSLADRLVLFPVGDSEVAYFATNAQALPPGAVAAMAAAENVNTCLNKVALYDLARALGLAVADFEVCELAGIDAAVRRFGVPCVVKPVSSLEDRSHLKALMLEHVSSAPIADLVGSGWPRTLVQRRVAGVRHNCHYVAHRGRLLAYFEQRVLRTTRSDGAGNGVDGISVSPSPDRRRACERLIEALDYSGPGCVQFIVDEPGRESWFLELNPRLDATCAIAEHAGYDLARLTVEEALHRCGLGPKPAALSYPYRIGIRGVWTTGDLRGLLREFGEGRINGPEAVLWCTRTIGSFIAADHHLTFRWSDPRPALTALTEIIAGPVWRRASRLTHADRAAKE